MKRLVCAAPLLFATLTASGLANARPGGWAEPGWNGERSWNGSPGWPSRQSSWMDRRPRAQDESRITVSRFVAEGEGARALARGTAAVTGAPLAAGEPAADSRDLATFEAAVVDQLARIGYRTDVAAADAGQMVELRIGRERVADREVRKPVSGEMAVGVSNRGSGVGLAVNVDLSKPRGALIATRLEARIRDKASGAVLWEGRADVTARDDDDAWSAGRTATRLAAALFDGFPGATGAS